MKTGTTDSGVIRMNDGSKLQIRLRYQGFFPKDIEASISEIIAETIHTYLRDSTYLTEKLRTGHQLMTEILEMELSELEAMHPDALRYTNVVYLGDLLWNTEVHLEEASAPCRISIQMYPVTDDD